MRTKRKELSSGESYALAARHLREEALQEWGYIDEDPFAPPARDWRKSIKEKLEVAQKLDNWAIHW